MEIEVHDSLVALAPEWDALVDDVSGSPFLRPGWVTAWWGAFGAGAPEVITVRREGRLAGVLPLYRSNGVLRSMSNDHSPECPILAEDDAVAELLARALLDRIDRRLSLLFVNPASAGFSALRRALEESRCRMLVRTAERSPYVTVTGEWEDFERRLGARLKRDLRRRRRRLDERGTVEIELTDGGNDVDGLLAEGFAVEASGWKGTGGTGTAIAANDDTRRFYTEVAEWARSRGWLHLAFMRLDGRALAFELSMRAGNEHHRLKAGHDESFRDFAPGKLLLQAVLEDVHRAGLRRFFFGGNDEAYKLEWANGLLDLVLAQVFAPTPRARVELAALVHVRPFAERLRGLVRRR